MIIEAIGAVMVAISILAIFLAFNSKEGDRKIFIILAFSILMLVLGGWLIIGSIGFYVLMKKAIGLFLSAAGIFIVLKFPGGYCQEGFYQNIAVLIGFVMIIFGGYLALF